MNVQRFRAALPTGCYPNNPEKLVRDPNGDFVKYEDYAKLRDKLDRVYEAGQWAISHVGAANYAERQTEAERKLEKAFNS